MRRKLDHLDEPDFPKTCPRRMVLDKWFMSLLAYRGAGAMGAAAPPPSALCSRGQLCPFLIIAIELFYHPNNFASDVLNVINESELIVVGRHWSFRTVDYQDIIYCLYI